MGYIHFFLQWRCLNNIGISAQIHTTTETCIFCLLIYRFEYIAGNYIFTPNFQMDPKNVPTEHHIKFHLCFSN